MFKNSIIIAIVAIVIGTFSINSNAQRPTPGPMGGGLLGVPYGGGGTSSATGKTDLVMINGGQVYGTAYAYDGSHFELYPSTGGVLKTYSNGCQKTTPANGVNGLLCSFGHFDNNGTLQYSGWALIYDNGFVYLRWMYQARSNFKYVDGDTGWVGMMPKS